MLPTERFLDSIDQKTKSIMNFVVIEYKDKPNKTFFEVESDLLTFNLDKYNISFPYNKLQDSLYKGKKITLRNKEVNFTIDILNFLELSFIYTFYFQNSFIQFSFNSNNLYQGYFYKHSGQLFSGGEFIFDYTHEYDSEGVLEEYICSGIEQLTVENLKFIHDNLNLSSQEIKDSLFLKYDLFDECNINLFIEELKKISIIIEESIKKGIL